MTVFEFYFIIYLTGVRALWRVLRAFLSVFFCVVVYYTVFHFTACYMALYGVIWRIFYGVI